VDIPATAVQFFVLMLFVVPGSVYQAVRQRLRGPAPDDLNFSNKLFRALGVSAALMAVYFALAGPSLIRLTVATGQDSPSWRGLEQHATRAGWLAIGLLLVVPALLALVDFFRASRTFSLRNLTYDPTPRAWDYTFRDTEPCYVRVLTTDGTWLGGWFGAESFISSFPEPREMFIEKAHVMEPDGTIGAELAWSAGLYIRCDDIRSVELLRQPVSSDEDSEETPDDGR